jgi:hypothetical protein
MFLKIIVTWLSKISRPKKKKKPKEVLEGVYDDSVGDVTCALCLRWAYPESVRQTIVQHGFLLKPSINTQYDLGLHLLRFYDPGQLFFIEDYDERVVTECPRCHNKPTRSDYFDNQT